MEDQDFKQLTTPKQKVIVRIRNYLTGADKAAIMEAYTNASQVTVTQDGDDEDPTKRKRIVNVDAGVEAKVERLKIERFVESVGGEKGNVADKVYAMRLEDTEYVVKHINLLTKGIGDADTVKQDLEKKDN